MNFQYIFPTCIYTDTNLSLATELLPIVNEYLETYGIDFSNYPNHISTYRNFDSDIPLHTDARLDKFKQYISDAADIFLKHQNIKNNYNLCPFFSLNKMGMLSRHESHAHANSILSGILYLDVNENCAPLIFKDPRPYKNFVLYEQDIKQNQIESLSPVYIIKPKPGMMLMWPSWLEHEVPLTKSNDIRTTLVFNLGEPYANICIPK